MRNNKSLLLVILGLFVFSILASCGKQPATDTNFGLVIHGGAGTISRDKLTPEQEQTYRAKLEQALRIGYAVLVAGGTSLDAVEKTIVILEDSP
ncbi:MAG: isoaspartyl peptidase/L-asparaginase, partial [Candidatus Marinimicrobia bacterium]|nr:isoaspartyl peptidase/L-asparaginase [Candidatus Neomarinimicrobiota bacterium]